jgi:hypothetical protein
MLDCDDLNGRGAMGFEGYPEHRAADVVLRDGSTVHVRPVRADDAAEVHRFLTGLSDRSRWMRFFSGAVNID